MAAKPLCPRTLRAVARKLRVYERSVRSIQVDVENLKKPKWRQESAYLMAKAHAFGRAAFVFLADAKALERKTKAGRKSK